MSFTSSVKDEVSKLDVDKTSAITELSAIVQNSLLLGDKIVVTTENNSVARRVFSLFKEVFNINPKIIVRRGYNYNKKMIYILEVYEVLEVLKKLGIEGFVPSDFILADEQLFRDYMRGVFMMCGSINDPKTARYHLEFNLNDEEYAVYLMNRLNEYDFNSKVLHRDNRYMLYIKEAEKIGDFLRMIDAFKAVMYYEDIRIYRDHKNMTNRLNNCEQANVDRAIETANKQVKDIELIESLGGLELLDEKEQLVAKYRLKYKEASLLELSEIISMETDNKITKSGLYHRFKKIEKLAERMKAKK